MDKHAFWALIDASRDAVDGDAYAQLDSLATQLMQLSTDEIFSFDGFFRQYHADADHWDLWAAAYIIGGGCSDDGFMDFRGWLISRGEKVYVNALRDPESLLDVVTDDDDGDCQIEGFQYLPSQVWEEKTGLSQDCYPEHDAVCHAETQGEAWDEDDEGALETRFPKLYKRFCVDDNADDES